MILPQLTTCGILSIEVNTLKLQQQTLNCKGSRSTDWYTERMHVFSEPAYACVMKSCSYLLGW